MQNSSLNTCLHTHPISIQSSTSEPRPDNKNQNYLSLDDLRLLGEALDELEAEGSSPTGIACIRLLALTGARKSEITKLLWGNIDFANSYIYLDDSKMGAKIIPPHILVRQRLSVTHHLHGAHIFVYIVGWCYQSKPLCSSSNRKGLISFN